MGTFHDNMGELHGITVTLRLLDDSLIVGRCHEATPDRVVLHDAERQPAEESAEAFLQRVRRFGQWPREKKLILPAADVAVLSRLIEYKHTTQNEPQA